MEQNDVKRYKTKSGHVLTFRAIAPTLIAKVQQSIKDPPTPTYEEEIMLGKNDDGTPKVGKIQKEHTEESIETDEERKAWEWYQEEKEKVDGLRREKIMQLFYLRGLDVELPDNGWEEDQVFLGIEVPEEPRAKRLHFLETEALASPEDIMEVITSIMALSGVEQEAIDEAKGLFRSSLQGQGTGEVVAEATGNGTGTGVVTDTRVDVLDNLQGHRHSVQMGSPHSFEFLEPPAG